MDKKYTQRLDNEWFIIGDKTEIVCCDCGLVHKIRFRVKDKLLWMKAVRLGGKTKQWRKEIKQQAGHK